MIIHTFHICIWPICGLDIVISVYGCPHTYSVLIWAAYLLHEGNTKIHMYDGPEMYLHLYGMGTNGCRNIWSADKENVSIHVP